MGRPETAPWLTPAPIAHIPCAGCIKHAMNRRPSKPLVLLLLCALLLVQVAAPHLHLCLDGNDQGSAVHLADLAHAPTTHAHGMKHPEVELNPVGELRRAFEPDDELPWLAFAIVLVLLLRRPRIMVALPRSRPAPTQARRLLPPPHAPPAFS